VGEFEVSFGVLAETIELARGLCGSVVPTICNVTDAKSVASLIQDCARRFGRIDVLVNNVGGPRPGGVVALSEDDWDRQVDLNLKSVFLTCKYVVPRMAESGGGSIVNIASTSGIRFTGAPQVAYAAAKAGVIQLSRVTAVEYAALRIRVNSIVPGQLHTPLVDVVLAKDQAGGDVESLLRLRRERIPLPIEGDGRDTANAALFLASDEARFITGTEILLDGGMSAKCG
jgi:NAD(P)-dependent dehydrogenase (short-subunit alcohol dehydrogenase family)